MVLLKIRPCGTLKIELAQYREVAASAQFDLDASTLLKQKQFVPRISFEIYGFTSIHYCNVGLKIDENSAVLGTDCLF